MPIYEYCCQTCQKELSLWFSSVAQAEAAVPVCTECGGENLRRLISSFGVARASGAAAMAEGARGNASQSLAQTMREAGAGRDLGKDFQEVATRLEKGESATAIEASLRKRVGEDMQVH
ncbi:MAG TPA: zinc ribbon domain-containing protein [Roseiflexaceae bacterium]